MRLVLWVQLPSFARSPPPKLKSWGSVFPPDMKWSSAWAAASLPPVKLNRIPWILNCFNSQWQSTRQQFQCHPQHIHFQYQQSLAELSLFQDNFSFPACLLHHWDHFPQDYLYCCKSKLIEKRSYLYIWFAFHFCKQTREFTSFPKAHFLVAQQPATF